MKEFDESCLDCYAESFSIEYLNRPVPKPKKVKKSEPPQDPYVNKIQYEPIKPRSKAGVFVRNVSGKFQL